MSQYGQRVSCNYETCDHVEHTGAHMKIYFDNPEYDGQFLHAVDHASLGAQIGEAWTSETSSQTTRRQTTRLPTKVDESGNTPLIRPLRLSELSGNQSAILARCLSARRLEAENAQPCSAKPATQGEEERPTSNVDWRKRRPPRI